MKYPNGRTNGPDMAVKPEIYVAALRGDDIALVVEKLMHARDRYNRDGKNKWKHDALERVIIQLLNCTEEPPLEHYRDLTEDRKAQIARQFDDEVEPVPCASPS